MPRTTVLRLQLSRLWSVTLAVLACMLTAPPARAQLPAPFNTTPRDLGTAPDQPNMQGMSLGEFEIGSGGQATYRIPITVPPGRAGVEPQLSLFYDSQSGNGPLGVGWLLGGPSIITRCASARTPDGISDPVDFDTSDQFCLDGQRLVKLADGTYRTQIDTFTRVEAVGGVLGDPSYFLARTQDGRLLEFGRTGDSRIEAEGRTEAAVWALNRNADRVGNYYTVTYGERSDLGFYAPLRIEYTGHESTGTAPSNRVLFHYEARPDVPPAFLAGSMNSAPYRLQRIETWTGTTPVHAYVIRYDQGASTGRSRVTEFQRCAFEDDGTPRCLTSLWFGWHSNSSGFENAQTWLPKNSGPNGASVLPTGSGNNARVGDFNGDGRADYMWLNTRPGMSGNHWHVALSTGTGFQSSTWLFHNQGLGIPVYNDPYQHVGDFNGDGRDDHMWFYNGGWHVAVSNGTSFNNPTTWLPAGSVPLTHKANYAVDLNHDGLTDYLWFVNTGNRGWYAALSTGSGFTTPVRWLASPVGALETYRDDRTFVADMNADGFPDLFWLQAGDGAWQVALSNGVNGFGNPQPWLEPADIPGQTIHNSGQEIVADLNGDGSSDYMWYRTSGWFVALSNGRDGFETPTLWYKPSDFPGVSISSSVRFTPDMNHDGRADYLWRTNDRWYVAYSTGTSLVTSMTGHWFSSTGAYNLLGDFTGDAMPDFLWLGTVEAKGVMYRRYGVVPDLLDEVIDAHGFELHLNYDTLANPAIYQKGSGAVFPEQEVQSPLYVLASADMTDGRGPGTMTRRSFVYRGLRHDLWRELSLGYASIEEFNEARGTYTTTYYNQDFPRQGTEWKMEVQTAARSRRMLSQSTVEVRSTTPGSHTPSTVYRYWVGSDTDSFYETNGTTLTTSRTTELNNVDAYNNPGEIRSYANDGYEKKTTTTYQNDPTNWLIGLPTRVSVQGIAPDVLSGVNENVTRTVGYEYYASAPHANTGLRFREIIEPDTPALRVTREFGRDAFGNITSATTSGTSFATRTETTQYDALGQFPVSSRNALNHLRKATYDARFGRILTDSVQKTTGDEVNFFTTTYTYDPLGRPEMRTDPDGSTDIEWLYTCLWFAPPLACPSNGVISRAVLRDGAPPVYVVTDLQGREVRRSTVGFTGTTVHVDTEYDTRGRVSRRSLEYFEGGSVAWQSTIYDEFDRPLDETQPDGSVTHFAYAGLATTMTNAKNQTSVELRNSQDQIVRVTDALSHSSTYVYDGFGNLLSTTDPDANVVTASYDGLGRRITLNDPDVGLTTTVYDALGQLTSETDAKNAVRNFAYDKLGRLTQRSEADGTTTFTYDTATRGMGKIASVLGTTSAKTWSKTFAYETYGRPSTTTLSVDGRSYATTTQYDFVGRISGQVYPASFATRNVYNSNGYLQQVESTAATPQVFWTAVAYDARGAVTEETFGNGLRTQRTFDPLTRHVKEIKTGTTASPTSVQTLAYDWDPLGNLRQRKDLALGLTENFEYDDLNRLKQAQVVGLAAVTYGYDSIGNLTSKSDVGTYTYGAGPAGPHAVTSTAGSTNRTFTYDANGNQITRAQSGMTTGQVNYTSFDKPSFISAPGAAGLEVSAFLYDEGRNLIVRTDDPAAAGAPTDTTYHAAGVFEELVHGTSTTTEKRFFIRAGGQTVAVRTVVGTAAATVRFLHRDHLGSLDRLTSWPSSGTPVVEEQLSFDAFGKRRNPTTWAGLATAPITGAPQKGFTGHEQLDVVGLIHMGGRVYDPTLGRFLSADPFVQFPHDTQGLNRYAYVLNNPLAYVDPSGFIRIRIGFPSSRTIRGIGKTYKILGGILGQPATLLSGLSCALGNAGGCFQFTVLVATSAVYGEAVPKAVQRITQIISFLAALPSPGGSGLISGLPSTASHVVSNFGGVAGAVLWRATEEAAKINAWDVLANLLNVAATLTNALKRPPEPEDAQAPAGPQMSLDPLASIAPPSQQLCSTSESGCIISKNREGEVIPPPEFTVRSACRDSVAIGVSSCSENGQQGIKVTCQLCKTPENVVNACGGTCPSDYQRIGPGDNPNCDPFSSSMCLLKQRPPGR